MKNIRLFFYALSVALLTGCGHNAIQFSKGIGFDAGFDPEHMSARVNLRYGEILSVAARDNIEVELATGVEGGQEQATASTKTTVPEAAWGRTIRISPGAAYSYANSSKISDFCIRAPFL